MPKFFTKKQFFAFLASFSVIFAVGIFAWFLLSNSEFILNKINSVFFRASVYPNFEVKEIFPAASTENFDEEYGLNLEEPAVDESLDIYTGIGGPDPAYEKQELLDDIAEKIDILQQQVNELTKESQDSEKTEEIEENEEKKEVKEENENEYDEEVEETAIVYSKVLIHETKISPIEQRFISLYNPNDAAVDLTGWYLQRKTATGSDYTSCVSKNDFFGKTILPGGYFLISRENSSADIFMPDLVLTESNYLTLKNPRGEISDTAKTASENFIVASGSSGSGSRPVYSKILISEVQIAGLTEEKEEFVELYNPNNADVDLTDWYLHRKTETGSNYSTFVSNNLFSGKKIEAMGYFLIAREESSFAGSADITTDSSLGNNGSASSLALKNPNGEISDKLGFGSAQDFESAPAAGPEKGQSIGRKQDAINNIEQDTDNNLTDFEAQNPTPKALNITYIAPEEPPVILTDTTAPEIVFTLDALQTNLTFTINFEITDILGTVTPSGISSYIFQWQEDNGPPAGEWQQDSEAQIDGAPLVFTGTREFVEGLDEKTYYFQIKAKDTADNESVWLPETPVSTKISIPKKVLINEIQIAGLTVKDEFIEFYNPNDFDINLSGFALKKKTASGSESNLVSSDKFLGIISALDYFLITPQDDEDGTLNYTGQGIPDLHYSGKSYSVAENNTILLYNNYGDLLDKVGFGSTLDFETAPALNPDENKSIARKELGLDTDDNSQDFEICETPTPTPAGN